MAKTICIVGLLLALLAESAAAGPRVLAVLSAPVAPYEQAIKGFERAFGSEVGRLSISQQKEKDILRKIRDDRPDMVLAVGRDALMIALRISTIPVVYCMVLNPRSLISGGSNISGISMNIPPEKQLRELMQTFPSVRSIGLFYDPDQTGAFVQAARDAAAKMDVSLIATAVRHSRDVPTLLKGMRSKPGVFWMLPDTTVVTPETVESLILFSLENRVPIVTFSEKYLEMGAMMSISIDPLDIGAQAGEMAQRILSGDGIKGDRYVDARKAVISVNPRIAAKLGISLAPKGAGNNNSSR